jgi:uncharacterized protein YdeI (YjbR/CyaY-like superfamily)
MSIPERRLETDHSDLTVMKITFFRSPSDLRKWFEKHHLTARELRVGYYKKSSGKRSITWPESVDEALCFGWIDGIRNRIDDISYTIRFTPRKPGSTWSAINTRRARELKAERLMHPAGLQAFQRRKENKSGIYSYEQRRDEFDEPYANKLKTNKAAWAFFQSRPPSYRKAIIWWVVSAKKEETRLKRLEKLIEDSARGRTISQFTPKETAR